jgi:hypothetical protein
LGRQAAAHCWFTGASLVIWRLNAFTDFVFFGGRRAGTTDSAIGGFGIDRPSVSGSVAGVAEITRDSEKSAESGLHRFDSLVGMTDAAVGALYAARPAFVKRIGCRSPYNPNAKPPTTARYKKRRNAMFPATPSPRDRE